MSWLRDGNRLAGESDLQRRTAMVAFWQPGPLRQRLAACRWLTHYLRWQEGDGTQRPYPQWTEPMKARLDDCFNRLVQNLDYDHPPLDRAANVVRPRRVFAPAAQAFDLYAGQVAHVLYVEAFRKVPWSLAVMDEVELLELLSSDRYFSRILPEAGYSGPSHYPPHILPGRDYHLPHDHDGVVHDPRTGFRFLRGDTSTSGINHIRATARETMIALNRWAADTTAHGGDAGDPTILDDWFQLEDRLRRRPNPNGGLTLITRDGWVPIPQAAYPEDQEN